MATQKNSIIVIGGGLGGLSAAISLAQSGYQVSLFEKNQHLGGKLNRLEQDGFGFDLGPSILTMPQIFEKLFTDSGRNMSDYIAIKRLNHEWRSFFPDGTRIDLYGDLAEMASKNEALTEEDMAEYTDFLTYAHKIYDAVEEGYFKNGLDNTREIFKEHGLIGAIKAFDYFSTMQEAIDKRISNQNLRNMLGYFIKYVGSSPYDAPAVLNMMIYMQHAQGAWYVSGGMHKIAEGLVKLARELGVELHTGTEVTRLLKENNQQIGGVQFADGSIRKADYYISNMEVIPTYDKLLAEDPALIEKLTEKFEPSSSGLVLHLGVDKLYPQLGHHNFFFSADPYTHYDTVFHQYKLPADPTIYLVNTNKTDPEQAKPGYENLKVLPHIPYIQDQPFTPADYLRLREQVLIKLENMGLTDLRQHIVTEDMWTPDDIQRTYGSHRGAIYGTVSNRKKNQGFKHEKHSEYYDNLYFVGGTVNPGGGMPMVTLSGQQVRDKIVKRDHPYGQ